MKNTFNRLSAGLALLAAFSATCFGDVIYQANDPTLTLAYDALSSSVGEIGDEVTLANSGFQFTGISIKYFANYNLPGGLTLTIYPQTGPIIQGFPSPDISNPLFQVRTDIISGNHLLNINYALGDFFLPNDFTFTLKFDGLSQVNDAGVFLGGRATIPGGIDNLTDCSDRGGRPHASLGLALCGDDVWTRQGPTPIDWAFNHVVGGYGNLNALIAGNVPEPGALSLGTLGCVVAGVAVFRIRPPIR